MTKEEIVMRLIGNIYPIGETNEDERSFENLKELCSLVNNLIIRIDQICKYKNSQYYSKKIMGEYADNFLEKKLGIK